ncbi:hypothetical protein GGR50DRAFT_292639 [Xylaria sp. CBS 124048]|nr:hypothetical protein GGR50DRAFT_292639 [Xylaria sp. CBS 124048]
MRTDSVTLAVGPGNRLVNPPRKPPLDVGVGRWWCDSVTFAGGPGNRLVNPPRKPSSLEDGTGGWVMALGPDSTLVRIPTRSPLEVDAADREGSVALAVGPDKTLVSNPRPIPSLLEVVGGCGRCLSEEDSGNKLVDAPRCPSLDGVPDEDDSVVFAPCPGSKLVTPPRSPPLGVEVADSADLVLSADDLVLSAVDPNMPVTTPMRSPVEVEVGDGDASVALAVGPDTKLPRLPVSSSKELELLIAVVSEREALIVRDSVSREVCSLAEAGLVLFEDDGPPSKSLVRSSSRPPPLEDDVGVGVDVVVTAPVGNKRIPDEDVLLGVDSLVWTDSLAGATELDEPKSPKGRLKSDPERLNEFDFAEAGSSVAVGTLSETVESTGKSNDWPSLLEADLVPLVSSVVVIALERP